MGQWCLEVYHVFILSTKLPVVSTYFGNQRNDARGLGVTRDKRNHNKYQWLIWVLLGRIKSSSYGLLWIYPISIEIRRRYEFVDVFKEVIINRGIFKMVVWFRYQSKQILYKDREINSGWWGSDYYWNIYLIRKFTGSSHEIFEILTGLRHVAQYVIQSLYQNNK